MTRFIATPLRACCAGLLALVACATHANAAPAETERSSASDHVRIVRMHIHYRVEADGTSIETREIVRKLISPQAVHAAGQLRIPYSASLDQFQVLEARTIKADGRIVPVPTASIFTQDGLISTEGVTSYQDLKTTVIVYPELQPGDSIALKSRVTRVKPMLPGHFWLSEVFPGDVLFDDVSIQLDAPTQYALKIESIGLDAQATTSSAGRTTRRWTYKGTKLEPTHDASVDPRMFRPRLQVSSIDSYENLARATGQNFAGKSAVTPAIRTMAAQIVGSATTVPEKARRIHDWVARNIRYFAIVLDVGGYVPRTADVVLTSRFGDCKDHTVLTQALLAAQGIRSYPALISTEPLYELPAVATPSAFNHVIAYVPEIDTYLETTSPTQPYGQLTYAELDKPVLLLGAASPVRRTPNGLLQKDRVDITTHITIGKDGSASGMDVVRSFGPSFAWYAAWADQLKQSDPVKVARQLLLTRNLAGEGTISSANTADGSGFEFSLLYELPDFADLEGPSGIRLVPPLDTFEGPAIGSISETAAPQQPYSCSARTESHTIIMTFPPGTTLTVPRDVTSQAPMRSYSAQYRVQGSEVTIRRVYTSTVPQAYCSADQVPAVRELQRSVLKDLRSQIRYTPTS